MLTFSAGLVQLVADALKGSAPNKRLLMWTA